MSTHTTAARRCACCERERDGVRDVETKLHGKQPFCDACEGFARSRGWLAPIAKHTPFPYQPRISRNGRNR